MTDPQSIAPGHPLIARVLITDPQNRVLLVHTVGSRPRWGLPGGLVTLSESPRAADRRAIAEELGLTVEVGDLLATEWTPAHTPGRRARLTLTFIGPSLARADIARIVLQDSEVDALEWADRTRAATVLHLCIAPVVGFPLAMPLNTRYLESSPETS
ncbi:NUDIX domain-containing protein [Streptomyces sp. NPDC056682]|uniref:NUDIX domain-containing protein n=1 Tax=Streptomyces sp. NPDC056682 TaxID=3345909 RepID=UPI00367FAA6E